MRLALAFMLVLLAFPAGARDDGRYANSQLKSWFDGLASGKGLCCSFADGRAVSDPDWGTHGDHYWVIVDNVRYAVPPEAIVAGPNKAGTAVVWPYKDADGQTQIRCFLPGGGA